MTHAEKAKKVPGISRYVINLAPDLSGSGRELLYDGFAEVHRPRARHDR